MAASLDDFTGRWVDDVGRVLVIDRRGCEVLVTVLCAETSAPYRRSLLLGRGWTRDLVAKLDERGRLIIEAGTKHLGPTFELEHDGDVLTPSVGMGLYDDFDDDLGVPWAFPLSRYRRASRE